jgi:hypothetical protein
MTDQAPRVGEVARQAAVAPDRAAQARARFGCPELAPLWSALRDRLERSAGPVRRVRVGPLSPEQRVALADLLGLDRLPGVAPTVPVDRLDVVLLQSPACLDSRGVVEAIGGPPGSWSSSLPCTRTTPLPTGGWRGLARAVVELAAFAATAWPSWRGRQIVIACPRKRQSRLEPGGCGPVSSARRPR